MYHLKPNQSFSFGFPILELEPQIGNCKLETGLGFITEPKDLPSAVGRIDYKLWVDSDNIEWDSIMRHQVLSEYMTLKEIRALGITARPVPMRNLMSIKRQPDEGGSVDKFKTRCIVTGHQAFMKKYEHKITENIETASVGSYVPFKILWDREGCHQAGYEAPL